MRRIAAVGVKGVAGRLTAGSKRVLLKNRWEVEMRERADFKAVELFSGNRGKQLFSLQKTRTLKYHRVLYRIDRVEEDENFVRATYEGHGTAKNVLEWTAVLIELPDGERKFLHREHTRRSRQGVQVKGFIEGPLPSSYPGPLLVAFQFSRQPGTFTLTSLEVQLERSRRLAPDSSDVNPHPLFDSAWYLKQLNAPLDEIDSPLAHYLRIGEADGLSPHPLFDKRWYLNQLEAPLEPGENVLEHYLRVGANQGLTPHPLFDTEWYATQRTAPGSSRK